VPRGLTTSPHAQSEKFFELTPSRTIFIADLDHAAFTM